MGNTPSVPKPQPVPIPVPIPVNSVKKSYRKFKDFGRNHTEKILNEFLLV